ncbi:hypothetical protein HYR99_30555 [Candidatus Poribacteria bacterium]|nr:hypothetical protein [Candidatus Poribacteria bacterium]
MKFSQHLYVLFLCTGLAMSVFLPVHATGNHASGGGTHFVQPGVRAEFQFSQSQVQCKVGHAVLPDGTDFQMFMKSTSIDSVTIESEAKTVVITGTMVSIVRLRFTDGTEVELTETVPYLAYAEDNGTPGKDTDFFALRSPTPTPPTLTNLISSAARRRSPGYSYQVILSCTKI